MCHFCNGTGYEPIVDESGDVEMVLCYECQPAVPNDVVATVVAQLLAEMRDGGVADPLGATVSLGAVVTDLYRLSGIASPIGLEAWVGAA